MFKKGDAVKRSVKIGGEHSYYGATCLVMEILDATQMRVMTVWGLDSVANIEDFHKAGKQKWEGNEYVTNKALGKENYA